MENCYVRWDLQLTTRDHSQQSCFPQTISPHEPIAAPGGEIEVGIHEENLIPEGNVKVLNFEIHTPPNTLCLHLVILFADHLRCGRRHEFHRWGFCWLHIQTLLLLLLQLRLGFFQLFRIHLHIPPTFANHPNTIHVIHCIHIPICHLLQLHGSIENFSFTSLIRISTI
uniref:Uncharacterized protein n=1 Tax=Lutzomyia longipalpis TaxID=7200 RepID=A0A1B0CWN3_LUTLO